MAIHPTRVISMCSGYGGLDLGLKIAEPCARCVCYVEREASAAASLVARMEDAALDRAPIWSDVTTFDGASWRGAVDCLIAGYPCQGESLAGLRRGTSDPRFIFPHIARTVRDARIPIVFCENVGAHLSGSFPVVARYMQDMGFTLAAGLFTASEAGASHKRERFFWLAVNPEWLDDGQRIGRGAGWQDDTEHDRQQPFATGEQLVNTPCVIPGPLCVRDEQEQSGHKNAGDRVDGELADTGRFSPQVPLAGEQPAEQKPLDKGCDLEHTPRQRCGEAEQHITGPSQWSGFPSTGIVTDGRPVFRPVPDIIGEWAANNLPLFAHGPADYRAWIDTLESAPVLEPAVRRMAYGRSSRMDRLRLCGNGVSPLPAAYAWCTLRNALMEHLAAKRANELAIGRAAE